jgi:choice-of-anchor B domain-containing protein
VVIIDVTDKKNIKIISTVEYSKTQYTHQGWFTDDQKYFIVGDEYDEYKKEVINTRSIIFDFTDLDNPVLHYEFENTTDAIDHNGYVHKNKFYLASYTAGLRVMDISSIDKKSIIEIGFFDTYNEKEDAGIVISLDSNRTSHSQDEDHDNPKKGNAAEFNGAWSVYPYFKSKNIIISDINSGLFIVKKQ